jgi:peptide/nickel transport system permease protein
VSDANVQRFTDKVGPAVLIPRRRSVLWRTILWTRKSSGVGALFVVLFVVVAVAAPFVAPYDPTAQDVEHFQEPPSRKHLFGTDPFGRDILSRVIWGGRISLLVGVVVVAIATVVGGTMGVVAGYVGGTLDRVLNFVIEMLMAVPLLLLALAFIAVLGPGLTNVMVAIGVGSVPMFARVLRAETRGIRERDYVLAADAVGASRARTLWRYVVPNIASSLIVLVTTRIATAMLSEASLSFLGIGIRPPTPSWGVMVAEGRSYLEIAPWIALIPGFVIMVTVLSFNLFGDGLRDALDVRLRHQR